MERFDCSGWATRANVRCTDGRIIMPDAFKHQDGKIVPLVWNHQHNDPLNVLGQVLLEHREEGVYGYVTFNETESGKSAKLLVEHGDVTALSICAGKLQQRGSEVMHGLITEVSLVLAGANPEAFIDSVIRHGVEIEDEAIIYTGEPIELYHADKEDEKEDGTDEGKKSEKEAKEESKEKSLKDILDTFTEEQQVAMAAVISELIDDKDDDADENKVEHSEGGNETMKTNVFDQDQSTQGAVLTHADQEKIFTMAKQSNVGSFQTALKMYCEENNTLKHGFEDIEALFPDHRDIKPGVPELLERDMTWVGEVMRKTNKSPISRIRTRQIDARDATIRAKGHKKGSQKTVSGNMRLLSRTTDPQTVYRKDGLHRDDIIDMDFDVVNFQYGVMKNNLYEDIALATMVGDLREEGDPDKISEEHIRPIWKDDELYTIHYDVDLAAAAAELQGSNTSANFGENYIYAEAVVTAALYSREQYKGSGALEFYATPHLINVMLLARDLNGRRIYDSKADLAKALNVVAIHEAEQFEGLERVADDGTTKKLLGIFVNLKDYNHGATKGGEITRFEQFDIDYNQMKYLIEARLSGALTRIKSAIVLEEPVKA